MQVELTIKDPVEVVERDLRAEFDGVVAEETISVLAAEAVRDFDDAPVREFVPILAWRRARVRARGFVGPEPQRPPTDPLPQLIGS